MVEVVAELVEAGAPAPSADAARLTLVRCADAVRAAIADLVGAVEAMEVAEAAAADEAAAAQAPRGSELTAALATLDASVSMLGSARCGVVSMVEREGRWRTGRTSSFADWRGRASLQGRGAALAEERAARALTMLPLVRGASQDGRVSMGHVAAIGDVLAGASERTRNRLVAVERELLAASQTISAPELRKNLAAMAASMEADAADYSFTAVRARRFPRLTAREGGVRIEGLLDPVAGETLRTALEALTPVPGLGDERTGDQRRADAVENLAAHVLGSGAFKAGAQVRPHLSILVPADTWLLLTVRRRQLCESTSSEQAGRSGAAFTASGLRGEPSLAQLQDGALIPFAALDVLACDALLQRVVLDAEGVPLDVGRTRRTFESDLRRAILTRDRHCQHPGCGLRATWCEVHHLTFWSHGGGTSLENGITLCSRHHHAVHEENLTIRPVPGGFEFRTADGRKLGVSSRLNDALLVPRVAALVGRRSLDRGDPPGIVDGRGVPGAEDPPGRRFDVGGAETSVMDAADPIREGGVPQGRGLPANDAGAGALW